MLPGSPPLTAQMRNTFAVGVHDALLPDFSLTASWLSAEPQTEQGYEALQKNMSAALIQLSPSNPLMGTSPLNATMQLISPYQLVQVRDVVDWWWLLPVKSKAGEALCAAVWSFCSTSSEGCRRCFAAHELHEAA